MAIYDTQALHTARISAATMVGGAVGALIPETSAYFLDYDGVTAIDGMLLPMHTNRDGIVTTLAPAGIAITTATSLIPMWLGKQRWLIEPASEINPQVNSNISIGSFDEPGYAAPKNLAYDGKHSPWKITYVVPDTSPKQFYIESGVKTVYVAADFTTSKIYGTHQYSASAHVGYVTMNFGQGVAGAKVRAALVATGNPSSGVTYATRLAQGEVVWSKFYPLGTQVSVDFSGLTIKTSGFIPPIIPLAPNVGEKRLMLAFYWESGTPVGWVLDVDFTYTIVTVVDTNAQ